MLCSACNRAIGLLKDNADTLMSAAKYLLAREPAAIEGGE